MSVNPMPGTNLAAAIAGSPAAAGHKDKGPQSASSASRMVEATEQVQQGDAAGDSEADGRQWLDSFEGSDQQAEADDPSSDDETALPNTPPPTSDGGDHLDLLG